MLHSVRFRLILMMVIVVTIAIGTLAYATSHATVDEFQHYLENEDTAHQERVNAMLVDVLTVYYSYWQSWEGVQALIADLAQTTSTRIFLVDRRGTIIVDSRNERTGIGFQLSRASQNARIYVDGQLVGVVLVYGSPWLDATKRSGHTTFIIAVNRYLFLLVVGTGAVALLLTLILSRRIVQPIRRLTEAAEKLAQGHLSQRVRLGSKDEFGKLAATFNMMADSLARAETLRRHMVTDIAHELRTPLACILGYLEALQDGVAAPEPELIHSLYEEATLLKRMIGDLQELALADAGQLKLVPQAVSLEHCIRQAMSIFHPKVQDKAIALHVELPSPLAEVYADPERLGQILRNLLSNAIAYTPEGGAVLVKVQHRDNAIQVQVHNTGAGIPSEHLPYVFERFYRVDPSRTQTTGGVGLGLAIVKQLVELHGGSVWVESASEHGSVFGFTLPTCVPEKLSGRER